MSIHAHQSGPWPHDFGGMGNGKNGVGLPINDQSAIQPLRKITLLVQILHKHRAKNGTDHICET